MPLIVLPVGGDVGIIMQKALTENLDIDVMTQLNASVLKTAAGQDCGGMDHIACSVGGST